MQRRYTKENFLDLLEKIRREDALSFISKRIRLADLAAIDDPDSLIEIIACFSHKLLNIENERPTDKNISDATEGLCDYFLPLIIKLQIKPLTIMTAILEADVDPKGTLSFKDTRYARVFKAFVKKIQPSFTTYHEFIDAVTYLDPAVETELFEKQLELFAKNTTSPPTLRYDAASLITILKDYIDTNNIVTWAEQIAHETNQLSNIKFVQLILAITTQLERSVNELDKFYEHLPNAYENAFADHVRFVNGCCAIVRIFTEMNPRLTQLADFEAAKELITGLVNVDMTITKRLRDQIKTNITPHFTQHLHSSIQTLEQVTQIASILHSDNVAEFIDENDYYWEDHAKAIKDTAEFTPLPSVVNNSLLAAPRSPSPSTPPATTDACQKLHNLGNHS